LNPEQRPWLTNPDWVRRRIPGTVSSNLKMTSVSWLSGVFALVIGGIGLLLKGRDAWSQKSPSSLVLLIIPVFGIALLFFSALLKLRARKYSGTYFEMESVPFFLGQKLRGTVHAPLGDFKGPVRFRLNCIRRRKSRILTHGVGVGGAKDTWDELVWCGQQSISSLGASADSKWTTMPAEIAVPADAPTTDSANPDDQILWSLGVSAKLWGVDFIQYFEVPVFTPSGVSPRPQYGDLDFYAPVAVTLPAQPPSGDRQVVERPSAGGEEKAKYLTKGIQFGDTYPEFSFVKACT
jgi:hypothetical protein